MKTRSFTYAVVLLTLALAPIACGRRAPLPPGAVVFQGAGVALVPGEDWKQLRDGPLTQANEICLPVLEGQGELAGVVVQVHSSPAYHSSPETRAASLCKALGNEPQVISNSIKQEKFVTDSGLAGVQVSYNAEAHYKGQRVTSPTHVYIIQNAAGCTVGLSVIARAPLELESVHQMIVKTLRLE